MLKRPTRRSRRGAWFVMELVSPAYLSRQNLARLTTWPQPPSNSRKPSMPDARNVPPVHLHDGLAFPQIRGVVGSRDGALLARQQREVVILPQHRQNLGRARRRVGIHIPLFAPAH